MGAFGIFSPALSSQFLNGPSRIAGCNHLWRKITNDDASSRHNGFISNGDTLENQRIHANPTSLSDGNSSGSNIDRPRRLHTTNHPKVLGSTLRIQRMGVIIKDLNPMGQ
jgi:hypothetical protein